MERLRRVSEDLRTFSDWNRAGYRVIRGQTSSLRNSQGIALFGWPQVRQATKKDKMAKIRAKVELVEAMPVNEAAGKFWEDNRNINAGWWR